MPTASPHSKNGCANCTVPKPPGCRSIFRPASKRHLMPELKTLGCCAIRANSRGSVCGDLSERPVSRAAHATNNTSSSINAPSRIAGSILPWLRAITQP